MALAAGTRRVWKWWERAGCGARWRVESSEAVHAAGRSVGGARGRARARGGGAQGFRGVVLLELREDLAVDGGGVGTVGGVGFALSNASIVSDK